MKGEDKFNKIAVEIERENNDVVFGKMMSSDGLKVNNKVFTFFHKEQMGFRLGAKFDPKKFGLIDPQPLSPFKTKPPLKGWFLVNNKESEKWYELTELALEFTRQLK